MKKMKIANAWSLLMLATPDSKVAQKVMVLINSDRKIRYRSSPTDKWRRIRPGAVIKSDGHIRLSRDAMALFFNDGQFFVFEDKGEHDLADLERSDVRKLNFDRDFGAYLMAAIDLVVHAGDDDAWGDISGSKGGGDGWGELSGSKGGGDGWGAMGPPKGGGDGWGMGPPKGGGDGWGMGPPKGGGDGWGSREMGPPKGGGDGWGAMGPPKGGGDGWGMGPPKGGGDGWGDGEIGPPKGGGDGWGDKQGRIVPILPFGKLNAKPVIFQWSQPKAQKSYQLQILDDEGNSIHTKEVEDNWTRILLDSLNLSASKKYEWRIKAPDDPDMDSTKVRFQISNKKPREIVEEKLADSEAYALDDVVLRALMRAVVLEREAWFYDAHQIYEEMRNSHPKNKLIRLMQAAFYLRYQLRPRAQQLFHD